MQLHVYLFDLILLHDVNVLKMPIHVNDVDKYTHRKDECNDVLMGIYTANHKVLMRLGIFDKVLLGLKRYHNHDEDHQSVFFLRIQFAFLKG